MSLAHGAATLLWAVWAFFLQRRAGALTSLSEDPAKPEQTPALRRHRGVSLLDVSRSNSDAKADVDASTEGIWKAMPPDWFGGDTSESSSDPNKGAGSTWGSSAEKYAETGWTPQFRHPGDGTRSQVKTPKWFHESESGGPRSAWQTHYPQVKNEFHHSQPWQVLGYQQWEYTPEGWLNDPKPEWLLRELQHQPGAKEAAWFDTSADNLDVYGRKQPPLKGTAQWLLAQPEEPQGNRWIERAINTTIMCATPGCTGASSLQAFDPAREEARMCKLNIAVHPTDFDDDFSVEPIDIWRVNGYSVRSQCDPMARGCNKTAWRPLYSCLREMDVDHIVDPQRGSMVVEGKLNKMVDECPYNGNYLSAVAVVSCLVREIPSLYSMTHNVPLTPLGKPFGNEPTDGMFPITVSAEVKCSTPGCRNTTTFYVDPAVAFYGGTCLMDVVLAQTDYDDDNYQSEFVEFIDVKGYGNVTARLFPGKNPCNEKYAGLKVPASHMNRSVKTGVDVTAQVMQGRLGAVGTLQVEGKISEMVDECGVDGIWLFYATVEVTCTPNATVMARNAAAIEQAAAAQKETENRPFGSQSQPGIEAPGHVLVKKLRQRADLVGKQLVA